MRMQFKQCALGKWIQAQKPHVHPVDALVPTIETAITYFASIVVAKSRMEFEDAKQELRIAEWLSTMRYNEELPEMSLESWIKTDLYYKARDLVRSKQKREVRQQQVQQNIQTIGQLYEEDHADRIIKRTALAQLKDVQDRQVVDLRLQGFSLEQIGIEMDLDFRRVSEVLKSVQRQMAAA